MKRDRPRKTDVSERQDHGSPPIPDSVLALILVMLAAALVLGYLFLNKMVDISQQEDCILAHRKDCAAIAFPYSSLAT
ncbi:hypothetical protein [Bradyrhizobium sp.]|uniref:hypothetical protein n=1 Tax=Bradyrhizobium sp. TaxID=376 RepID=UPI003C3226FB